jgi:hypothetical protein
MDPSDGHEAVELRVPVPKQGATRPDTQDTRKLYSLQLSAKRDGPLPKISGQREPCAAADTVP